MTKSKEWVSGFTSGIVVALDCVSLTGNGVLFREIVVSAGQDDILKEIRRNGLPRTKRMARFEFMHYEKGG